LFSKFKSLGGTGCLWAKLPASFMWAGGNTTTAFLDVNAFGCRTVHQLPGIDRITSLVVAGGQLGGCASCVFFAGSKRDKDRSVSGAEIRMKLRAASMTLNSD
jgi:hypothetical protein